MTTRRSDDGRIGAIDPVAAVPAVSLSARDAVAVLRRGGIVAYPTEAVWGLGCDPFDEAATRRLLAIKQRSVGKGLILVADDAARFDGLLDWPALPAARRDAVLASWPGPNTWIVPATARVPAWITGAHSAVAVRVSAHPAVRALCAAYGGALVSTSANCTGEPPARGREELDARVIDAVDALVDGETGGDARPTTIRIAATGEALRA